MSKEKLKQFLKCIPEDETQFYHLDRDDLVDMVVDYYQEVYGLTGEVQNLRSTAYSGYDGVDARFVSYTTVHDKRIESSISLNGKSMLNAALYYFGKENIDVSTAYYFYSKDRPQPKHEDIEYLCLFVNRKPLVNANKDLPKKLLK